MVRNKSKQKLKSRKNEERNQIKGGKRAIFWKKKKLKKGKNWDADREKVEKKLGLNNQNKRKSRQMVTFFFKEMLS